MLLIFPKSFIQLCRLDILRSQQSNIKFKNDFAKFYTNTVDTRQTFVRLFNKLRIFKHDTVVICRERLYDNLILFTRQLQIQSNIYLLLQLRRTAQHCFLYRRIYSPNDFKKVLFENTFNNLKLIKEYKNFIKKIYSKRLFMLSLAACCAFWDDNRITEEEFDELIQDFNLNYEKYLLKENVEQTFDTENLISLNDDDQLNDHLFENDCSFTVGNCLQFNDNHQWEKIINRDNFHVWRKLVNNSLYQYKGVFHFELN